MSAVTVDSLVQENKSTFSGRAPTPVAASPAAAIAATPAAAPAATAGTTATAAAPATVAVSAAAPTPATLASTATVATTTAAATATSTESTGTWLFFLILKAAVLAAVVVLVYGYTQAKIIESRTGTNGRLNEVRANNNSGATPDKPVKARQTYRKSVLASQNESDGEGDGGNRSGGSRRSRGERGTGA
mmetsp:Transcript_12282/g.26888  ORF Transcript_12282/g.26888 Transcript_12282/m.26888 type:complete len:189 (+) Transcript_12282:1681-2247(+)